MIDYKNMLLGTKLLVSEKYIRKNTPKTAEWVITEIPEVIGIFTGYRTLSNGTRNWDGDEGWSFRPTVHIQAIKLVYSARMNSILVPISNKIIEVEE